MAALAIIPVGLAAVWLICYAILAPAYRERDKLFIKILLLEAHGVRVDDLLTRKGE